jgi:hypothetical protein
MLLQSSNLNIRSEDDRKKIKGRRKEKAVKKKNEKLITYDNYTHFQTRIDEIKIKINISTEHSRIIAELCNDGSNELASKICNERKEKNLLGLVLIFGTSAVAA